MIRKTDEIEWRIQEVMEALERRPRESKPRQMVAQLERASAREVNKSKLAVVGTALKAMRWLESPA